MSFVVKQQLIDFNRPKKALSPQGWVIHATADLGATAQNIFGWFNQKHKPGAGSSSQYACDWIEILRMIPDNEQCWGAGPTANAKFLQVEICEPATHDVAKFNAAWNRAIWLVATKCVELHWGASQVYSHAEISSMYKETDHQDPIAFFKAYGKTMEMFRAEVSKAMDIAKGVVKTPANPYIKLAQKLCNDSGYRDSKGRKLLEDGVYGANTEYALPLVARGSKLYAFVKLIQQILKIKADGQYGMPPYKETYEAIRDFQRKNSLAIDGMVGKSTWAKLLK